MDNRKILIVNLNRGLVGEDNAALLGALLVTKIQLASMSRADIPHSERVPFYLYVDEFQHFATDSFATILSEARKYALNLTVANQYIAQMSQEVKDAVFGNVGSMISFRMGADDARSMLRYFEPRFTEYDLVHMHNRHFVINMTIDGEKSPAFSAFTIDIPEYGDDFSNAIIEQSRRNYAKERQEIELIIHARYSAEGTKPKERSHQTQNTQNNSNIVIKPERTVANTPQSDVKRASDHLQDVGHTAMGNIITLGTKKRRRRRRSNRGELYDDKREHTIFKNNR